jgi:antitoxin component YwqK of YwqJK toxin-antitoxin module
MKLLTFLFFIISGVLIEKEYQKNYYPNRSIKSEGWIQNNQKTDYWFYYYPNGNKREEGHYRNNKKCKWWIFYNAKGEVIKKSEFKENKLEGFSATYEEDEIVQVEKFSNNKLIKKWISVEEFKEDNPLLF